MCFILFNKSIWGKGFYNLVCSKPYGTDSVQFLFLLKKGVDSLFAGRFKLKLTESYAYSTYGTSGIMYEYE